MKISVVTPTYNRAHTLTNLYKSLLKNRKYSNFEWLIMDDGSTDDTEKLIKKWIKEYKIDIKYFKQKNKGKMEALNNLISKAKGELLIEVDSDDYLTDDAFKIILEEYKDIKDNDRVYALAFNRKTKDNKIIGNQKKEGIYRLFDMYFKMKASGDSPLVFKTKIRKKYKYKLENNERFSTEGRMYHEIDLNYDGLKWISKPIVICEYLDDGYSKNINNIFKSNPYGYYAYYKEMFDHDFKGMPFKSRLHILKHYILFSKLTDKRKIYTIKNTKGLLNKLLVTILVIPGYILTNKSFKDERKKVLFISSTGGHLGELMQLKSIFKNYNYHIITDKDKTTKNLINTYGSRIDYLVYGTKDNLLKYIFIFPYNIIKSFCLFIKIRPKVIITTGAHTCVPICYIGKLFRRKIIYIETFANSETRTLTGRMIYPIANTFIVQWESMLKLYPKAIYGGWIY